jgi:hypothetical protein
MHLSARPFGRRLLGLLILAPGIALCGCAGGVSLPGTSTPGFLDKMFASAPQPEPIVEKVAEKKSGCGTPAQCRSALKTMVDSPKRGWVGQKLPPDAYTDGTRLFAYLALRKRLNCRELSRAVDEVRAVSKSLNGPMPGISADQASRTRTLNTQVESELVQERSARCRA